MGREGVQIALICDVYSNSATKRLLKLATATLTGATIDTVAQLRCSLYATLNIAVLFAAMYVPYCILILLCTRNLVIYGRLLSTHAHVHLIVHIP